MELYRVLTPRTMEKAIARARATKGKASWIAGRDYKVIGSTGLAYTVKLRTQGDKLTAFCGCKGFEVAVCIHVARAQVLDVAIQSMCGSRAL